MCWCEIKDVGWELIGEQAEWFWSIFPPHSICQSCDILVDKKGWALLLTKIWVPHMCLYVTAGYYSSLCTFRLKEERFQCTSTGDGVTQAKLLKNKSTDVWLELKFRRFALKCWCAYMLSIMSTYDRCYYAKSSACYTITNRFYSEASLKMSTRNSSPPLPNINKLKDLRLEIMVNSITV